MKIEYANDGLMERDSRMSFRFLAQAIRGKKVPCVVMGKAGERANSGAWETGFCLLGSFKFETHII